MKVFTCIFAVATTIFFVQAEMRNLTTLKDSPRHEKCRKKLGIDQSPVSCPVVDRTAGCFWACYFREKMLTKDGKLADMEQVLYFSKALWNEEGATPKGGGNASQVIKKCYRQAEAKTDVCEAVQTLLNCQYQQIEGLQCRLEDVQNFDPFYSLYKTFKMARCEFTNIISSGLSIIGISRPHRKC